MSDFADNHITNLGTALLARVMAGEGGLTFTRIVLGDGNMPSSQSPATMTDVVSPRAQASITKAVVSDGQTAVVGARFTNEEQDEAFTWRELGLYAKVGGDADDVLYSYGYTPEGELIPAGTASGTLVEKLVDVVTYVGDAAEVTAIFDPDFIPQVSRIEETAIEAMWEQGEVDPTTGKSAQYLDRPGLSQLVHDIADAIAGAGPTVTADEVTVSMTAEGVLSIKASGVGTAQLADFSVTEAKLADGAVTTGKLADKSVTAEKLADGAITIEQLDKSSITPSAIGAAAAEHVHDAADVTSGTLPVERGGTGVTTDDALFQKVVSSHYPTNEELLAYLGLS
ncbi:phage tail protein [Olsenella sp. An293]|uniref:phage tail-collar fiber domain-containing protein n=1 Tax=Olsenella sp. An293 TaxID=1965626 RepID=UPI000B3A491D|nr:phage tail protein [Olsenella sp. An293]OUO32242.1 hypothetical protein B5F85_06810 [Olsenella sp. An293]